MKDELDKHPSYGVVTFNIVNGNDIPLFGSALKHNTVIRMTVKTAARERHLYREWISSDETILIAELSMNQFVEAITKLNDGTGTPITLIRDHTGDIESPPYINQRTIIQEEAINKIKKINEKPINIIKKLKEMLSEKRVKRNDIKEVIGMMNNLVTEMGPNTEYIISSIMRVLDAGIDEAKVEIESAVSLAIHRAGVEAIDGDVNKLIDYMLDGDKDA